VPITTGEPVTLVIPDVLEESCVTRQTLERLAAKWREPLAAICAWAAEHG
jgi:hypothetical protein